MECLDEYTTQVHMAGDNKYMTQDFGLQQAYKGVKIAYFPPVLMIQLKRFEYSFQQQRNVKILTQLQYEEFFDFSRWSMSGQKQQYELYAVLVHEGARAQSGHYYNFVKSQGLWFKCNDQQIQQVSREKVFNYNFGGFHQSIDFDTKEMKVSKKMVESKTTAYMLVYIKTNLKDKLMNDQNAYPQWIMNKQEYKQELEEIRKNKKKFFHNVGYIDWQKQLENRPCAHIGFLDKSILEKSKRIIQKIPKQAKISQWLYTQNIIEAQPVLKNNKKAKKGSKAIKNLQQKPQNIPGIYIYYETPDRQTLTGFAHKPHHSMQDLLKISSDPTILKTPFQVSKQEYLAVIKRFKVVKSEDRVDIQFYYEALLPVPKQIKYIALYELLSSKYSESQNFVIEGEQNKKSQKRLKFYVDDQKMGPIRAFDYMGSVPYPVPIRNQLLVCVVEELPLSLTIEQQQLLSFPNWYKNKRQTITLVVSQQKFPQSTTELKQININLSLSQLRTIIFNKVLTDKEYSCQSPDNIVLKARFKKGSKLLTQVSQSECTTVKDLTKYQNRIQFAFSTLSVQSRQSQYELHFYYRSRIHNYSEPFQMIVNREDSNQRLVERIKTHQQVLELLKNDLYKEDQAELVLFSKDRHVINDVVNKEGKVYAKGQLDAVLKKQKNAVLVVQGRNFLLLEGQPKIQIKQDDVEPFVSILLHHVSQNSQRVGTPRYFKVDRRMELFELKTKVLNLIMDEIFGWQGKIHPCQPFKTRILLYAKDNKKTIDLTDLQSLEEMKRLKIQQKDQNQQVGRKKSKEFKNSIRKSSLIQENKQRLPQSKSKRESQQNGQTDHKMNVEILKLQNTSEVKKPKQQREQHDLAEQNDQINSKQQKQEVQDVDSGKQEAPSEQQVTQIQGPQTIYGIFPKVKILKIQIIHNYLIKPNIALRLNVE